MGTSDNTRKRTRANAPGAPGLPPRWAASQKTGVGTALDARSRVWFSIGEGILTETYFPEVDSACTRDLGCLISGDDGFFSEERTDAEHVVEYLDHRAPAFRVINTCRRGAYRMEKTVCSDPHRAAVLQRLRFGPHRPDLRLYALLNPQVKNTGWHNNAWIGHHEGETLLMASRDEFVVALACSLGWGRTSAGFVGVSDGWQDIHQHGRMTLNCGQARGGNVALTGEIDFAAGSGECVLALGFGRSAAEAGGTAVVSLRENFERMLEDYIRGWRAWHEQLEPPDGWSSSVPELLPVSCGVIRVHEAKGARGAIVASLSIPWGMESDDKYRGGYHLAWPRDLCESAGGLLACKARVDFENTFRFLQKTQREDGHWAQNMWLDGTQSRSSIQMDETAFPILLTGLGKRDGVLTDGDLAGLWPMVRRAAAYLSRRGPSTLQDRWEEVPGYTPFTLATEVAALIAAADIAAACRAEQTADFLRKKADAWNARIEEWTYLRNTPLGDEFEVDGYYARTVPRDRQSDDARKDGMVSLANWAGDRDQVPAAETVSPDVLALVRFGLRRPDDPRILNTLKIVDARLKVDTPFGPCWRRHDFDGYGEYPDGSPFDGHGVGRLWPLLTGERAHYEIASGRREAADALARTFEGFANRSALFPEQVWDMDDLPDRRLYRGRGTGSAAPLVWAHAEYLKLRRSLESGAIFDELPAVVDRYGARPIQTSHVEWSFTHRVRNIEAGKALRLDLLAPARVRWTVNGWQTFQDVDTRDSGLGVYFADLPARPAEDGDRFEFTFYWIESGNWEGSNFGVDIIKESTPHRDEGALTMT